jgi:hypothetical protein
MTRLMLTTLSAMMPRPTAIHSGGTLVSAAVEAVSPFHDADASLASGAPHGRRGTSAFSGRAFVQGFWSSDWECNALDPRVFSTRCGDDVPRSPPARAFRRWRARRSGQATEANG